MRFTCSLTLPRDVRIVPMARHFCQNTMREFGVEPDCCDDVALAFTEACANVVRHASSGNEEFVVNLQLDPEACVIEVVDQGQGFDLAEQGAAGEPDRSAIGGRGLFLMHALVDRVHLDSRPQQGTIVRLEKKLVSVNEGSADLLVSPAQGNKSP